MSEALELLFGVKGGSEISPGTSGGQIKADIDSIVKQLHAGGSLELNFSAKQDSLSALRDEIKKAASNIEVTFAKGGSSGGDGSGGTKKADQELKNIKSLVDGWKQYYALRAKATSEKYSDTRGVYDKAAYRLRTELIEQEKQYQLTAQQTIVIDRLKAEEQRKLGLAVELSRKAAQRHSAAEKKAGAASLVQVAELRSQYRSFQKEMAAAHASGIVKLTDLTDLEDVAKQAMVIKGINLTGVVKETDLANINLQRLGKVNLDHTIKTISSLRSKVKSLTEETISGQRAAAAVSNSYDKLANRMQDYMTRIQASLKSDPYTYQKLQHMIDQVRLGPTGAYRSVIQASAAFQQLQGDIKKAGLESETLGQSIARIFKQKFGYGVIATAALVARRSLRQVYQDVVEIDAKLTELQIVSGESGETMVRYMDKAAASAKRVSAAITDIIDATTVYRRLGFSMSDSLDFAELTTMYSKVGGVEIGEAESNITAIIKAFNLENADKLREAMDKIVRIGNNFAISSAEIGQGLNNAASALVAANNSFEESLAVLTAAQAITQDASKSSTAIRTIAARLTQSNTELEALGEEIDSAYNTTAKYREKLLAITGVDILKENGQDFKSTFQILRELAGAWEGLSDLDQASVTYMVAGIRNSNVFNSLMQQWKDAEGVVKAAATASGAMSEAYEVYTDSIEGRLNVLKASAQELNTDLLDDSVVKGAVSGVTALVNAFDRLIDAVGPLPVVLGGIGLAGLIRSVGALKTELIGANVVLGSVHNIQTAVQWLANYDDAILKVILSKTALSKADQKAALAAIAKAKADRLVLEVSKEQILTDAAAAGADRTKIATGLNAVFVEKQEAASIKACTQAELEHILVSNGVDTAKAKEIAARYANGEAARREGLSIKGAGDLAKAAAARFGKLITAAGGLLALAAAVGVGFMVANAVHEGYQKRLDVSKEKNEALISEVSTLEQELRNVRDRIEEINSLDTPTLADMEELKNLKETNRELQLELDTKRELQHLAAAEAEDNAAAWLRGNPFRISETTTNPYSGEARVQVKEINWNEYGDIQIQKYHELQAELKSAREEAAALAASHPGQDAIEEAQANIASLEASVAAQKKSVIGFYTTMKENIVDTIGDSADTEWGKDFLSMWEKFLADYEKVINGLSLENIDLSEHTGAIAALTNALNGGGNPDWEGLYKGNDAVRTLIDLLVELGIIDGPTTDGIRSIAEALDHMGTAAGNAHDALLPTLESFSAIYDRVTAKTELLTNAQSKLSSQQDLTNAEIVKLLDAYPSLISCYDAETGKLKVTVAVLQDKIDAEIAGEKAALESSKKTVQGYLAEAKAAYAAAEAAIALAKAKGAPAIQRVQSSTNSHSLYQSAQLYFKDMQKVLVTNRALYTEYQSFLDNLAVHQGNEGYLAADLRMFQQLQSKIESAAKSSVSGLSEDMSEYQDQLSQIEARMTLLDQLGKSGFDSSLSSSASSAASTVKDAFEELKEQLNDWFGDMEFKVSLRVDAGDIEGSAKLYRQMIDKAQKALDAAYSAGRTVDDDWVQELIGKVGEYKKALADLRLEEYDKLVEYNDDFDVWNKVSYQKLDVLAGKLEKINDLYLQGYLSYKDWYDYYTDTAKQIYDLQRDALDELLDTTMDAIKRQNDVQVEALEKQSDVYQKLIDQKKQLLEDTKDQSDYEREVAKRVKEIAKLQERITQLELDDSREAAAERHKLESELAEKQEALADYQAEYGTDAALEALDKQGEAFDSAMQDRIDAVKAEVESETELRRRAIALIDQDYQKMMQNVKSYFERLGITIDSELLDKLTQGLNLVSQFGSYNGAESGIGASGSFSPQQIPTLVEQMKRNSQSWHTAKAAGDKTEMQRLNDENERIAQMLKTMFGLDIWKNAAQGKWYIRLSGKEMALFDAYHQGGVVPGYPTKNNKEVMSLLEKGEVVLDDPKQARFISIIENAGKWAQARMASVFSRAVSSFPVPVLAGSNTLGSFSPTFQFTFHHSGPMTEDDARHYGEVAADTALDKLWATLQKRGIA